MKQFYRLLDEKKLHFYSKYTIRGEPFRKANIQKKSRKSHVYKYYLEYNNTRVQVCKELFCGTLSISQQRIYYFHEKIQNPTTSVPRSPLKGRNVKKHTSNEKLEMVRNHIKSFPVVESHYCRAKSNKQYLDGSLTLTKMYDLFKVTVENSVKENIYRKVLNEEFNLSFFNPKKDRCDECEEYKILEQPSEERKYQQELHIQRKIEGFEERTKER